ncbi:hypothetical protein Emed_004831 [Eimeria media]
MSSTPGSSNSSSNSSSSSSSSSEAVESWIVCWNQLPQFSAFCSEIQQAKRAAVEARKRLASDTKENRRLWSSLLASLEPETPSPPHEDGINSSSSSSSNGSSSSSSSRRQETQGLKSATEELLKAYQQEVDVLTKRSKAAEATFQTLLQLLLQQPDLPVLLRDLQTAAAAAATAADDEGKGDRVSPSEHRAVLLECQKQRSAARDLAQRNARLEVECRLRVAAHVAGGGEIHEWFNGSCQELEAEVSRAKDQSVTVRRLELQLQQQQRDFQGALAAALAEKEEKLRGELSGADSQLHRQLHEVSQQLKAAQQQNSRLEGRLLQQQQQFVRTREELENKCRSLTAEVEMLSEARSRSNHPHHPAAAAAAADAATTTNGTNSSTLRALQAAQQRVEELMKSERNLEERLETEMQQRARMQAAHEESLAAAAKRSQGLQQRIQYLETQLLKRPTEAEVSELQERLEAAVAAAAAVKPQAAAAAAAANGEETREKLARLEAANAALAQQLQAAKAAAAAADERAAETIRDSEDKIRMLLSERAAAAAADGTQDSSSSSSSSSSVGAGVLQLVASQRDAYRQRLSETEQDRDTWRSMLHAEQQRRESLAADNRRLLEALRRMQSKPQTFEVEAIELRGETTPEKLLEEIDPEAQTHVGDSSSRGGPPLPLVHRSSSSSSSSKKEGGALNRRAARGALLEGVMTVVGSVAHAAADTASCLFKSKRGPVGPRRGDRHHHQQQQQQLQQQLQQLGAAERVVVIWGRALLGSKATRLFALLYFGLLHFLLFALLFYAAEIASQASTSTDTPLHQTLNE